jgi:hypothetical protein
VTSRFKFDVAKAYASALRADGPPPATIATTATKSGFVAKVADVAGLAAAKYEARAQSVAEVANVAGGPGRAATEPVLHVDEAEREAIAVELGGVPIIYAAAFAHLQAHAPPEVPLERWHQFVNDAGIFLDQWGCEAERLGWRAEELFGLHPEAPMARYDQMGFIWMLNGERAVALTATRRLTFYRKG